MPERPPHQMHSAQGEIADWAHAEMPFAGGAKCSLCHANGGANFGQIKWLVGMCLQEFHEPGEYRVMTAATVSLLQREALGEASDQDASEPILQRPGHFREFENVRGLVSELPDALVQI